MPLNRITMRARMKRNLKFFDKCHHLNQQSLFESGCKLQAKTTDNHDNNNKSSDFNGDYSRRKSVEFYNQNKPRNGNLPYSCDNNS